MWEGFTGVGHEKIGFMYAVLANVMPLRRFADAFMITKKALSVGARKGYLLATITTKSSPPTA